MTAIRAAEDALARVAPLTRAIGITRLAVLTGLDVIGLPVAAAVRPNSRTVAVHQGKGATLASAKVAALMEGLECCCAETQTLPLRLAMADELARTEDALDVGRLPRCAGGPDPAGERLLWVAGRGLASGRPVWVPRELVAADFAHPPAPGSGVFQATTNGLGAGLDEAQAILHALCEVVERDALALWHAGSEARQAALRVDPDSVDGPLSRDCLRLCAAAGVAVAIWDATTDVGVPVFVALLTDPARRVQPELGSACRLDSDAALAAALAEAAQARVTTISGARDDMTAELFESHAIRAREAAAAALRGGAAPRSFVATESCTGGNPVETMLRHLERAGCADAACVVLTRPEMGLPVVRAVIPGLEGPWTEPGGEYVMGARARAVR